MSCQINEIDNALWDAFGIPAHGVADDSGVFGVSYEFERDVFALNTMIQYTIDK